MKISGRWNWIAQALVVGLCVWVSTMAFASSWLPSQDIPNNSPSLRPEDTIDFDAPVSQPGGGGMSGGGASGGSVGSPMGAGPKGGAGGAGGGEGRRPPEDIPIEKAMREFQARYHYLSRIGGGEGKFVQWPNCAVCGTAPAGPFPKDGFYDKLRYDPYQMAELVRDLARKFWGNNTRVYPSFVVEAYGDLEGKPNPIPEYGDSEMPQIKPEDITVRNYEEKFATIRGYLQQLIYLKANAGNKDVEERTTGLSNSSTCNLAKQRSSSDWDDVYAWSNPNEDIIAMYEFTRGWSGPYHDAMLSSNRGRISADLTGYPGSGSAQCYLRVKHYPDGVSNGPPVQADELWHSYSIGATIGGEAESELLANRKPVFTSNCPQGGASKGWEVIGEVVILAPDFDTSDDGQDCETCGRSCSLGRSEAGMGSMYYRIGLGSSPYGGSAGRLVVRAERPRADLAAPAGLAATVDPTESGGDPMMASIVVHRDSNDEIDQVKTPEGLADVVDADPQDAKYRIDFYYDHQISGWYPPYTTTGTPFRRVVVEHPQDGGGQPITDHLRVTEHQGSPLSPYKAVEFQWDDAQQKWDLLEGLNPSNPDPAGAAFARSVQETHSGNERTETFVVEDRSGPSPVVVRKRSVTYTAFAWGEERTERVVWHDPSGQQADQLITTWSYYDDEANDGDNYSHLERVVHADGSWARYTYDADGSIAKAVSQLDNRPPTAAESQSRVVLYTRHDLDLDGDGTVERVRKTLERGPDGAGALEDKASRYRIDFSGTQSFDGLDCREAWAITTTAANPGAGGEASFLQNLYADADHLGHWVTKTLRIVETTTGYDGSPHSTFRHHEPKRVIQPGGERMTLYEYPIEAETITISGVPNAARDGIVRGTERVREVDAKGNFVRAASYAVVGGSAASSPFRERETTASDPDLGRPTEITYLDGTTTSKTYAECGCGPATATDRRGVTTVYEYDKWGRTSKIIRADGTSGQLTTTFEYDPVGRRTGRTIVRAGDPNLTTTFRYDAAGRLVERTGPAGKSTFMTYGQESTTGKGYESRRVYPHDRSSGPVRVAWSDGAGHTIWSFTATVAPAADWAGSPPTGGETLTQEFARTVTDYDWRGRTAAVRRYHDLTGLSVGDEPTTSGEDYYDQSLVLAYSRRDSTLRARGPAGDITATVYDRQGRAVEQWRGTDAAGATRQDPSGGGSGGGGNDMRMVSRTSYDDPSTGDPRLRPQRRWTLRPNLTALPADPTPLSTYYNHTDYEYDDAGRPTWTRPEHGPWTRKVYGDDDAATAIHRGKLLETAAYQNGSSTYLLARTTRTYDGVGRVAATRTHETDGAGGLTGDYLETAFGYDDASRRVRTARPGGGFTKTAFDDLGRVKRTITAASEGVDTAPDTFAGDTVLTESVRAYDAAGNVIQSTTYRRRHDAGSTTGLLSAAPAHARTTYAAVWYDHAHRPTHRVRYGTNGGSSFTRPATAPEPDTSDGYIVAKTVYALSGRVRSTVDHAGSETRAAYDAMGRVVETIENYTDGDPATDSGGHPADEDRTTETTYTPAGQRKTLTAVNPAASGGTGDQTTTYVYSGELTASASPVASNRRLRAVIYPDSDDTVASGALSDGPDAASDRVQRAYYADGALRTRTDPRSVEITYTYDDQGRRAQQEVTAAPSDLPGDRLIAYAYTDRGQVETVATYSDAAGTTITSETLREYDGLGALTAEYQQHGGAVNTSTSPVVHYAYDNTADGNGAFTKGHRRTTITYPSGRVVHNTYSSGVSDELSRPDGLAEDSGGFPKAPFVKYAFLGAGQMVRKDYTQAEVRLDYADGSGAYAGLDRFGRVVDHRWTDYGSSTDADRFRYGYDRAGNRLFKENVLALDQDELYTYDGLRRLTDMERGTLNAARNDIATLKFAQNWALDPLGNWNGFDEDADGDGADDLVQSRSHNEANEIASISESSGAIWVEPAHDAAGNMITMPRPESPANGFTAGYDAWNRMVRVSDPSSSQLVAEYAYDGFDRRSIKKIYDGGTLSETRHFYYSARWQVLEERVGSSTSPERQHVWGLTYIDEIVQQKRDTNADGALDKALYALQDANYNVTAVASDTGSVVERYRYNPYGQRTVLDADYSQDADGQPDPDFRSGHQGLMHDAATDLIHNRNRVLHPALGRFARRDPLGTRDGTNLYQYVASSPGNYVDPLGTLKAGSLDFDVTALTIPYPRFFMKAGWAPIRREDADPDGAYIISHASMNWSIRDNRFNMKTPYQKGSFGLFFQSKYKDSVKYTAFRSGAYSTNDRPQNMSRLFSSNGTSGYFEYQIEYRLVCPRPQDDEFPGDLGDVAPRHEGGHRVFGSNNIRLPLRPYSQTRPPSWTSSFLGALWVTVRADWTYPVGGPLTVEWYMQAHSTTGYRNSAHGAITKDKGRRGHPL